MSSIIEPDSQASSSQNEPENNEAAVSIAVDDEADIAQAISDLWNADIYLYSGPLDREGASRFMEVAEEHRAKENAVLILTTHGGTADAAFRIARYIKRTYTKFILYVFGPCKSAGTLLAIGADQIVMSCWGEFGPLDVQLVKRDDLLFRNSGLDIAEALKSISAYAFTIFEKQFIELIARSGGAISTRTAGEIAKSIAVGLLAPITAQLDPLQIGEVGRAVRIASDYAGKLKAHPRTIQQLVRGYSSHSFVIDYEEAKQLFPNVRLTKPIESQFERSLRSASMQGTGHDCIREPYPHDEPVVAFLEPETEEEGSDESEQREDLLERGDISITTGTDTEDAT